MSFLRGGRLGNVLKAFIPTATLPATASLGLGSFGTVPRKGVIRGSLLHPPLTYGPLICGPQHPTPHPRSVQENSAPSRLAQAPKTPASTPGTQAKSWEEERRSAPGALRPDAHLRKRPQASLLHPGEPQPVPSKYCPAWAASTWSCRFLTLAGQGAWSPEAPLLQAPGRKWRPCNATSDAAVPQLPVQGDQARLDSPRPMPPRGLPGGPGLGQRALQVPTNNSRF